MEPKESFIDIEQIRIILGEIQKASKNSIEALLQSGEAANPLNLLITLASLIGLRPANSFDELKEGPISSVLELVAFHLFPHIRDYAKAGIPPVLILKALDVIKPLLNLYIGELQYGYLVEIFEKHGKIRPADEILVSVRTHACIVRGSAYPEQTEKEIVNIQGEFEDFFRHKIGLGPKKACELVKSLIKKAEQNATAYSIEASKAARDLEQQWREAKRTKGRERSPTQNQLLKYIKSPQDAFVFGSLAALSELAPFRLPINRVDLEPTPSEKEWDALIGLIGLTQKTRAGLVSQIGIQAFPLWVLPHGQVLLIDLSNTLDVLWDKFENVIKNEPEYQKYQDIRAKWLDQDVCSSLTKIFPPESIFQNVSYPDPDDSSKTAEMDHLVYWPPFVVLVENKSKQFRLAGQLGDLGRLRTDLKENVEEAFDQAIRARRYLKSVKSADFKEIKGGRKISIPTESIERTFLITVSQHHLAGLANRLASLRELSLFKKSEYPYCVSAGDLETISQFCEGPDIFLHYIERRLKIEKGELQVKADELDFFGAYLTNRLDLRDAERENVDFVQFLGWHSKFDAWMAHKRGDLQEIPASISLEVPDEILKILRELRKRDSKADRSIALALLEMPNETLQQLAGMISELKKFPPPEKVFRHGTHMSPEALVVVMMSTGRTPQELETHTQYRTQIEMYRRKATRAVGLGMALEDAQNPFHCLLWLQGPWAHDAEMEKLLEQDSDLIPVRGSLPGRNDPCYCGSRKKFKKCHIRKLEEKRRIAAPTR